jgi:REP element-mobilizing transposase RayT
MARKLRLEFSGANYHVINRGNYRGGIFAEEGAQKAFEECLFEACERSGWVLHAFAIMRNHFHLALKTPEPNLVLGMQWLQATFAARFNRFRREQGHLFQGRYKALVIEDGDAVAHVCDYIHLNPVRAGVVDVTGLREYRYSSYWYLWRPKDRPGFLHPELAVVQYGDRSDDPAGWRAYEESLAWQAKEGPAGKNRSYVNLSRGWALGSDEFKRGLVAEHGLVGSSRAYAGEGSHEIKLARWEERLNWAMRVIGKDDSDLDRGPKSEPWKVAVAAFLKQTTQASNPWLAQRMRMGLPAYVSRLAGAAGREPKPSAELRKLRTNSET